MAKAIIKYLFNDVNTSNPDGKFPVSFTNTQKVPGPGKIKFDVLCQDVFKITQLDNALDLGNNGKASVQLTGLVHKPQQFCLHVIFQATGPVQRRQNIVESNMHPFAIYLEKGTNTSEFDIVSTVKPSAHNWNGPKTRYKTTLKLNNWYSIILAYDYDTAALFINGQFASIHAFPKGSITELNGDKLFFGSWTDGVRNHFKGKLAAFQWFNEIPNEIESLLDEMRGNPGWFISHKYELKGRGLNFGLTASDIEFDSFTGAHIQKYQNGSIMYHDNIGAAFEIHGGIYAKYNSLDTNTKRYLGYLVSDEVKATNTYGRKSVFQTGAIYWSSGTGAHPVLGQLYLDYEDMGESKALGFPKGSSTDVAGGNEQIFQMCRMYYKKGDPNAFEVHGAILSKFLGTGGVSKWGFPVSNELDVTTKTGNQKKILGKYSEFSSCTIYWSSNTGAYEVHGEIRKKYLELGGPFCFLGFPTSDESDIPNYSGTGRINTFQNGSILWYGGSNVIVARPFKIFIGRINTKESEGLGMGQNDIYVYYSVVEDSNIVHNKRHPGSDWGNRNIKDWNYTLNHKFVPNRINKKITYQLSVYDNDPAPNPDDFLGKYKKVLSAANAWGYADNNGSFNSGRFSKINSIKSSIIPVLNYNLLDEKEKWWDVRNIGSGAVSWAIHASAFRNIDSQTEWWDVTDWLEKAFYELVTKNLCKGGNCFGMSLESIYARKGSSIFPVPTDRFKSWSKLEEEFNIKHLYQVGSGPIWWFVGQFLSGNTHDPKDVFNKTRAEFNRGNNPVICVAQNYDFSGAPHCILPVKWDSSSKPWKISICDPNFRSTHPNFHRVLLIDPDNNTFTYAGGSNYSGGEWTGGRLFFYPFSRLSSPPRTPLWDAILLLLAGTVIILADDAQTVSLKNAEGKDMSGHSNRAKDTLKSGESLEEYFVSFKGLNTQANPGLGNLFFKSDISAVKDQFPLRKKIPGANIGSLLADPGMHSLATALGSHPAMSATLSSRSVHHVLNDDAFVATLTPEVVGILKDVVKFNSPLNFEHNIKGNRNGTLKHVIKDGLNEVYIETPLNKDETHKIEAIDLGSSKSVIKLNSLRVKNANIKVVTKLGVKDNLINLSISNIPLVANKKFELNVKPGLGGVELQNVDPTKTAAIKFESIIDGKRTIKTFNVPLKNGARIKYSHSINNNELVVSYIDKLFGVVKEVKLIK